MDNAHTAVKQADREEAARTGLDLARLNERDAEALRQGGAWDEWSLVQAFARHRIATTADLQSRLDACEAALADAYYVLTYVQGLSDDDETEAACQEVRDKIDALATTRNADAKGGG